MANAVVTVLEADGVTQTDVTILDVGRQAAAASKSVGLATEDKAVLDAIAASASVLDDWDESDRAKVNPIVGQAGVAAGSGAISATTQRVALATDSPGVTALGQATMANSLPVSMASNQTSFPVTVAAGVAMIGHVGGVEYETVAASQTDQMAGATGAAGDYLAGVLIIPATTSPGAVSIEDGATNIPIFTGGASSVSNLVPFFVPLGIKSVSGGWEITTGANVSAIAVGDFT